MNVGKFSRSRFKSDTHVRKSPAPYNSYIFLDLTTTLKLSDGVILTSFEKIAD
jgi:hypothetical protein